MNLSDIKILHIDSNHPLLWEQLEQAGFYNEADFKSSKQEVEAKIENYHGIVIRSRFKIDKTFIDKAKNLKGQLKQEVQEVNGVNFLTKEVDLDASGIKDLAFDLGNEIDNLFVLYLGLY